MAFKIMKQDPEARRILSDEESLDAISLYLHDIGSHGYLTPAEERAYFARLDRKWHGRLDNPPLPIPEKAKPIRAEISQYYLKLVASIAKGYNGKGVGYGDLIQEGNEGLFRAINKFDPARGYMLTTYATWWIRQAITRAVHNLGRTIRIPVHVGEVARQINKFEMDYMAEWGEPPIPEQIAEGLGKSVDKINYCINSTQYITSLDTPMTDEEDVGLYAIVGDNEEQYDREVDEGVLKKLVEGALSTLSAREAQIISFRFGLNGCNGRQYTLEEVGRKYGLTRERVRQIEGVALRKLRHPRRARKLKEFL